MTPKKKSKPKKTSKILGKRKFTTLKKANAKKTSSVSAPTKTLPKKTSAKPQDKKKSAVRRTPTKSPARKKPAKTASPKQTVTAAKQGNRTIEVFPQPGFPVVGMGASAGGLQAFEEFFRHIPADAGMAFVLVSHLDPDHASILHELLRKSSTLPVEQITDGVILKKDHVYVSPPGRDLAILNGKLQLMMPTKPHGSNLPIDYWFRSLAQDQMERAIGIILSGNGSDGTLGVKAIKGESGMVMAQDPESSKFSGMPTSAIATGLVDFVLPAAKMPAQLMNYVRGPFLKDPARSQDGDVVLVPSAMQKIFILLRSRTGHDFSHYKTPTLHRRIARRMNIHQIKGHKHYIQYLENNPQEVDLLFKELLIGVSSFFRDPEVFERLAKHELPELIAQKNSDTTLRVWIPGCSTGEEAYSLAILLRETMDRLDASHAFQIFATDLNAQAIETARTGRYPDGIIADVTSERLRMFFTKEEDHYRIKKEIRETVIFAEQNFIKDPPFTKLDLVSCRNLLIYLQGDLQKQLVPLFHYVLKPGGVLVLGPSESIGTYTDLFRVVDKRWKVFIRRVGATTLYQNKGSSNIPAGTELGKIPLPLPALREKPTHIAELSSRLLSDQYAPPSAIVNEKGDIIYIHGQTGLYLQPAPGQPSHNILNMAREGLSVEISSALRKASQHDQVVLHKAVKVRTNGGFSPVDLTVHKITTPETMRGLFLVAFAPASVPTSVELSKRVKTATSGSSKRDKEREVVLEREVQYIKESLQSTIEELETSNEELKSTNEELQSTNEEMQSTNEEMETSKEEMQSLNEELQTVNSELQGKNDELSQANNDMMNLLNATDIATIFLDNDLCIKRFTHQATELVRLISSDVGRPISDIVSKLNYDSLEEDARRVLTSLIFKEAEVQGREGNWFYMRIMPYRTVENVIDGVVITFVNVDRVKKAEAKLAEDRAERKRVEVALKESEAEKRVIVEKVHNSIHQIDTEGRIISINAAGRDMLKISHDREIVGRLYLDLVSDVDRDRIKQLLTLALKGETSDFEFRATNGRDYLSMFAPISNDEGDVVRLMGISHDITEAKQALGALYEGSQPFSTLFELARDSIVLIDPETATFVEFNRQAHEHLGYTREEFANMLLSDIDAEESASDVVTHLEHLVTQGREVIEVFETKHQAKDGRIYDVQVKGKVIVLGKQTFILNTWQDVLPADTD